MQKSFLLLLMMYFFAACNSGETAEEKPFTFETEPAAKTEQSATSKDSNTARTAVQPFELTAEEELDDAAFVKSAKPSTWSEAGITDPLAFKIFLKKLQYWSANDMKDSIAAVLAYPIVHPYIANKQDFIDKYDTYFNSKVKTSLANQKLNSLFRSYQGVMLTGGALWFKQKEAGFKITFINN